MGSDAYALLLVNGLEKESLIFFAVFIAFKDHSYQNLWRDWGMGGRGAADKNILLEVIAQFFKASLA